MARILDPPLYILASNLYHQEQPPTPPWAEPRAKRGTISGLDPADPHPYSAFTDRTRTMVYPTTHTLLTFHWLSVGDEQGQFGLRIAKPDEATLTDVDNLRVMISSFWASADAAIASTFRVYMVKASLIAPDGKYPPGHVPVQANFAPVAGGGGSNIFPLQAAAVTSLRGAAFRAPAGRGRIYLPMINSTLQGTGSGLVNSGPRSLRMNAVKALINGINALSLGNVRIYSSKGAGASQNVVQLAQGDRPDVQRRRAAQQPETYAVTAIP